jgi:hypothetical protein
MRPSGAVHSAASGIKRAPVADSVARSPRARAWNAAVAVSAGIVIVAALLVGVGWLTSLHTRTATSSYSGAIDQINLRLSSGDAVIVGSSSSSVEVRRTDESSFGHSAREHRTYADGVLQIESACPRIVVGSCSASYELAVPETAAVDVQTTGGNVRLEGFRGGATVRTGSGNVDAEAYCGFDLAASSQSGQLRVGAACAPEHLQLRTTTGDAVALVPPGRYRIATSGARQRVTGVTPDPAAPFTLDVHSKTGNITIGSGL